MISKNYVRGWMGGIPVCDTHSVKALAREIVEEWSTRLEGITGWLEITEKEKDEYLSEILDRYRI